MIQKLTPFLTQNALAYVQRTVQSYEHKLKSLVDQAGNLSAGYSVRQIKEKDSHFVGALIRKVLLERGGIGIESLYYDRELNDVFGFYSVPGHSFSVLTYQKEVVGTAAIGTSGEKSGSCELKKFYLLKEHRAKGMGKVVLKGMMREAVTLGYDECMLRVDSENIHAIRFFKREGFSETSDNSNTSNVHECIMAKKLNGI